MCICLLSILFATNGACPLFPGPSYSLVPLPSNHRSIHPSNRQQPSGLIVFLLPFDLLGSALLCFMMNSKKKKDVTTCISLFGHVGHVGHELNPVPA